MTFSEGSGKGLSHLRSGFLNLYDWICAHRYCDEGLKDQNKQKNIYAIRISLLALHKALIAMKLKRRSK